MVNSIILVLQPWNYLSMWNFLVLSFIFSMSLFIFFLSTRLSIWLIHFFFFFFLQDNIFCTFYLFLTKQSLCFNPQRYNVFRNVIWKIYKYFRPKKVSPGFKLILYNNWISACNMIMFFYIHSQTMA